MGLGDSFCVLGLCPLHQLKKNYGFRYEITLDLAFLGRAAFHTVPPILRRKLTLSSKNVFSLKLMAPRTPVILNNKTKLNKNQFENKNVCDVSKDSIISCFAQRLQ